MVLDTKRCIGCWSCAVDCRLENNTPNEMWWNRVLTNGGEAMDTPAGTYPNLSIEYLTLSCQHCDDPACTKVCPVSATYKRADGIVIQDPDKCIGCRMCMAACPYTGVRSFNFNEPAPALDFALGDKDAPKHVKHTVEKCTFCVHRIDRGETTPACVEGCPAVARFFGDLDDPDSEVSQLIATREYKQLLTERGTGPNIYYLL
jgi:molybdopterin-containing oxidoreductase family iron-sulfur binding subunit